LGAVDGITVHIRLINKKSITATPVRNAFWFFLMCVVFASAYAGDTITLQAIPPVEAPVIDKKILRLTIDLSFTSCPQEYWVHHDKEKERLIIEFFGIHVDAPVTEIKGTSIVSDLTVVNKQTDLSLQGKSAQLSMALQKGWHYESWILNDRVLRLQLWMPLNPRKVFTGRKNRFVLPLLFTTVGVAVVTFGAISISHNANK
jgi:hypothetical protein